MCVGNRCSLDKIGFLFSVIFLSHFRIFSLIECIDCKGKICVHVVFSIWQNKMLWNTWRINTILYYYTVQKWKWFPAIYPRYKTSTVGNMHEKRLKHSNVASKWIFRSECDDETIIVFCVCTFSYSIPSRKDLIQFDWFKMNAFALGFHGSN